MIHHDYRSFDQSEMHINGTCNYFRRLGGLLHVHRQVEIMFSAQGDVSVFLGEHRLELHTGDFVIIKPFELHAFSAGMKLTNKFIAPILPDTISARIALRLTDSIVCHDNGRHLDEIFSLYKAFAPLSPENRILYFRLIENVAAAAIDRNLPTSLDSVGDAIIQYIQENYRNPLTLESVAAACCTNRSTVSRTVNRRCNRNFNAFLNHVRINRFLQDCLAEAPDNIEAAAQQSGFQSARTFYRAFYSEFQSTPSQYLDMLRSGREGVPPDAASDERQ